MKVVVPCNSFIMANYVKNCFEVCKDIFIAMIYEYYASFANEILNSVFHASVISCCTLNLGCYENATHWIT